VLHIGAALSLPKRAAILNMADLTKVSAMGSFEIVAIVVVFVLAAVVVTTLV
jgi:hypothetical protein